MLYTNIKENFDSKIKEVLNEKEKYFHFISTKENKKKDCYFIVDGTPCVLCFEDNKKDKAYLYDVELKDIKNLFYCFYPLRFETDSSIPKDEREYKKIGETYYGDIYEDLNTGKIVCFDKDKHPQDVTSDIEYMLSHPWSDTSSSFYKDEDDNLYHYGVDVYDDVWIDVFAEIKKELIENIIMCMKKENNK
jgi:hypothetical protein